jgi:hypothetical protein
MIGGKNPRPPETEVVMLLVHVPMRVVRIMRMDGGGCFHEKVALQFSNIGAGGTQSAEKKSEIRKE